MNGMLGKKIGMTQVFDADGCVVPVTVIKCGPCSILQIKTESRDGYNAVQLGFKDRSAKNFIKEVRNQGSEDYKVGQEINVSLFSQGEFVDIAGTSIGRGFQGGIKRWNWSRGPETHGSMSHRAPGSIGASAFPSRVVKGHHLPGHMGNHRVSVQNLEVIKVDRDNHLLIVKGSLPGHKNSYLLISKSKKNKKPKNSLAKTQAKPEQPEKQPKQDKKQKPPGKK